MSNNNLDNPALQFFPPAFWTKIPGNEGACPDAPPAGSRQDIALQIWANKRPGCPKERTVTVPDCLEPVKQTGDTTGAIDDSACRLGEDMIISVDILQPGIYSFDMCRNVPPPDGCAPETGNGWDSYMYLTQGDPCTCAGVIAENDNGCSDTAGLPCVGLSAILNVPLNIGSYWIVIEGFDVTQTGPFDLHITCQPPATGDVCPDRVPIGDGLTAFSTIGALTDGPPDPACQFDGQTYHDIWYNYTAVCNGLLQVSTCNQADYDTDLVVYDGCDCVNLNLLGCNDDAVGCAGFTSQVVVPVLAGNCYKIRVGGFNPGDQGTGNLQVVCSP